MMKLLINYKWKKWASSLTIVACCMIGILIPFSWMSTVIVTKLAPFLEDTSKVQVYFVQINNYINQYVNLDLQSMDFMSKIGTMGAGMVKNLLESSVSTVSTFFFMFIILYFLLYDCFKVEHWFKQVLPFTSKNSNAVVHELKNMIFSNAIGTRRCGNDRILDLWCGRVFINGYIDWNCICSSFGWDYDYFCSFNDFYDGHWAFISRNWCGLMGFYSDRFSG